MQVYLQRKGIENRYSVNKFNFCSLTKPLKYTFKYSQLVIQLSDLTARRDDQSNRSKRVKPTTTHDLVFQVCKTNPANFLKMFEKCSDVKSEKDKLYNLRNFVNENHRTEFSKKIFENDWKPARFTFLKKYSMLYTNNKQRDLDFSYEDAPSLRSFVARKMEALSTYTTLSVENQLEVILLELPKSIANSFIVEDKLNSTKEEILEFCDLIQEFVEDANTEAESAPSSPTLSSDTHSCFASSSVNELEIFTYNEGVESSSDTGSTSTNSSRQGSRGKIKKLSVGGRPAKIPKTISERSDSSFDSDD